ncbi:MAG: multiple sugar transport system permease protein [Thermomicrobiales bacterium]|nr:multiple sugar transport system permease protein [Thermomicrobiales bacterium]MEA2523393.1 multiple sugar transport system permease protein [Thermomicrobiales bacterium]
MRVDIRQETSAQTQSSTTAGLPVAGPRAEQRARSGWASLSRIGRHVAIYGVLIVIAILVLAPLEWVAASSFTTRETVWKHVLPFSWRAFLPDHFTLDGYRQIFEAGYGRTMANTFVLGAVTVVLSLTVGSLAGFTFARFEFRGKRFLWAVTLISFMVPYEATVIPAYTLVNDLGWINSWQALIVPAIANGTVIFLFRQFFAEIPQDLIDAGRVDGATWPRILAGIVLPLTRPVIITSAIIIFLSQWNSFFWPQLVAPDAKYRVVQVAVNILGVEQQTSYWDRLFAATTIAALVPLVLVIPLQRYYVSSIVSSGIKG